MKKDNVFTNEKYYEELPSDWALKIPHEGKIVRFSYSDENYYWLMNRKGFRKLRHRLPTPSETISLVHAAYTIKKYDFRLYNIQDNINRGVRFWDMHIHSPEGVYMCLDYLGRFYLPDYLDREREETKELIGYVKQIKTFLSDSKTTKNINGVLVSKNKRFAFAPKNSYQLGRELSPEEIKQNGLIIALARGKEGAEVLAKTSEIMYRRSNKRLKISLSPDNSCRVSDDIENHLDGTYRLQYMSLNNFVTYKPDRNWTTELASCFGHILWTSDHEIKDAIRVRY